MVPPKKGRKKAPFHTHTAFREERGFDKLLEKADELYREAFWMSRKFMNFDISPIPTNYLIILDLCALWGFSRVRALKALFYGVLS
jgi:hypothetical protein